MLGRVDAQPEIIGDGTCLGLRVTAHDRAGRRLHPQLVPVAAAGPALGAGEPLGLGLPLLVGVSAGNTHDSEGLKPMVEGHQMRHDPHNGRYFGPQRLLADKA